jgi:hypothetical protein
MLSDKSHITNEHYQAAMASGNDIKVSHCGFRIVLLLLMIPNNKSDQL